MQALRGLTEHSGVKSERSRFLESDLRKLLVWRKRVATGDPEATDLPFEITVMLLAPRRALPPTVQLALQIPFPPSLLRQNSGPRAGKTGANVIKPMFSGTSS